MPIDFADVLMQVVEPAGLGPPSDRRRSADDPLSAAGSPHSRATRVLNADGHAGDRLLDPLGFSQRQRLENNWQIDFAYADPWSVARFRVNAYFQRGAAGRRVPSDPL